MHKHFALQKAWWLTWVCFFMLIVRCTSEHEILLTAARTGNTATRIKAIEKLASRKWDEKTENVVIEALNDAASLVRKAAAEALAGRGMPVAWPLVRRLRDSDVRVRVQVVKSLHTLPVADFIVIALIRALEDPSQAVRREVVEGFRQRGWTERDILVWQAFEKRMHALESLAALAAVDRAVGLEQLGVLRAPQDFAFLLSALSHTDAFLVQIAAKALARGGEPELLDRLLEVGGPEPEVLLATWLENAIDLSEHQLNIIFSKLPVETLLQVIKNKKQKLPCIALSKLPNADLVNRIEENCILDPSWNIDVRFAYLAHHQKVDAQVTQEALSQLDRLSAFSFHLLANNSATTPAVIAWVRASWERYIYEFQKWIPERTWQAMDLVSPADEDGFPKPPSDELSRLLGAYRARATASDEEHELFVPQFDVERFARQLDGLAGVKAVSDTLQNMLQAAPPPLLAAVLRVFSTLVVSGEKLPQAVLDAVDSPDLEVQNAALSVLAAAGESEQLIARLRSVTPKQVEFILEQLEKTQDPGVQDELRRVFTQEPSARLALTLVRMGVSGIREEIVSLLSEDTPLALSAERALLLEALSVSGEQKESFLRRVELELWHPSSMVRCRALRFLTEVKRKSWAQFAPEWEVRRCAQN